NRAKLLHNPDHLNGVLLLFLQSRPSSYNRICSKQHLPMKDLLLLHTSIHFFHYTVQVKYTSINITSY
ncbi:hypothetical protein, partial [Paenibacillus anseongense]|uniref:hypothetical protein n=1 Tax=Paenibacillus anseongense TaxID=2682845 RepID=UPI002DB91FE5